MCVCVLFVLYCVLVGSVCVFLSECGVLCECVCIVFACVGVCLFV